jgi:uncharacterized protein involved in exopolysaccharide biosynthesis
MSQTPEKPGQIPPEACYDEDEINLLDLLLVILKRREMIFKAVCVVFILSIIISLLLPKSYIATSRILPPQEKGSSMSGLLSQVGGSLGGLASGMFGGNSTSDVYIGILKSRTVADNIIKKFNLKDYYEIEYMAVMYEKLADISSFDVDNKSQIISIMVEDHDPQRAADMANSYVEALDYMNRSVNITEGQRKRAFLEERLQTVKEDLIRSEINLKVFQEKYKLISINEQAKVTIEGAASLKAQIIAAQTELEVLKNFGTQKQNEALKLQAGINELQKQLSKIESGGDENAFYIPFNELPELGMQLARLTREFKIQENVFELLTSQYELAKIEEAKDVNTIQLLDKAVPPDKKAKPKRGLIVILCTFAAFFIAVFTAFFLEFVEKIKNEDEMRYKALENNFKNINLKGYIAIFKKCMEKLKNKN